MDWRKNEENSREREKELEVDRKGKKGKIDLGRNEIAITCVFMLSLAIVEHLIHSSRSHSLSFLPLCLSLSLSLSVSGTYHYCNNFSTFPLSSSFFLPAFPSLFLAISLPVFLPQSVLLIPFFSPSYMLQ